MSYNMLISYIVIFNLSSINRPIDQNSISRYDTKVAKEHMKKGIRVSILY